MATIRARVLILIGVAVGSLIRSVHAQTDVVLFRTATHLSRKSTSVRSTVRASKFVDHSFAVNSPSRLTRRSPNTELETLAEQKVGGPEDLCKKRNRDLPLIHGLRWHTSGISLCGGHRC